MRRWAWQREQQVTGEFLVCVGSRTFDVGEGPERLSIVQTECTCSLYVTVHSCLKGKETCLIRGFDLLSSSNRISLSLSSVGPFSRGPPFWRRRRMSV